jgi:hypothetical protein
VRKAAVLELCVVWTLLVLDDVSSTVKAGKNEFGGPPGEEDRHPASL